MDRLKVGDRFVSETYIGATKTLYLPVVADGLLLYWGAWGKSNADATPKTWKDLSPNGRDATLTTLFNLDGTYGWHNNGLVYDSSILSAAVTRISDALLAGINDNFTLEIVASNVGTANSYLFSMGAFGSVKGFGIRTGLASPFLRGYLHNGTTLYTFDHARTTALGSGTHHFAFSRNGTDIKLYIDGVVTSRTAAAGINIATSNVPTIGSNGQQQKTIFAVRLYNRTLSDAEIELNREYDCQRYSF